MKLLTTVSLLLAMACLAALLAQTPSASGEEIFTRDCAGCHVNDSASRAPSLAMLRGLEPAAVMNTLTNGKMAVQGASLSVNQRQSVSEFVTGRSLNLVVGSGPRNACPAGAPLAEAMSQPSWNGWGATPENTRFQSTEAAGIAADDVPRLKLAWAFGFPGAIAVRAQPTVIGNWLFMGSETGDIYALDAKTGCRRWTYKAQAAVRTAIKVAPFTASGTSRYGLYFGDGRANAYGLDAENGSLLWTRKLEEHPNAAITGPPAVHDGLVFIPVSGAGEEVRGQNPNYACCTFRGSVTALDIQTGEVAWKSYSIQPEPSPRGTSSQGVTLMGPAGAGIWGSPTIDAARGVLYIGTGNGFAGPQQPTSNAIIAMDLSTGAHKWARQTVPNDIWLYQCDDAAGVNPNCPEEQGPDFDFGSSPLIAETPSGRPLLIVPQKSGVLYALDPDNDGAIVWQYRMGVGSSFGAQWGAATDGRNVYIGVADTLAEEPGGMHAVDLETGQSVWVTPPQARLCQGGPQQNCYAAQGAAISAIPGVVFSGGYDGGLRAYSAQTGEIVWQFDSNRAFDTVNDVQASGGTMDAAGPVIAGGMLYVNSGYNGIVGRAGNVLLAFRAD